MRTPLAGRGKADIDFYVVRENTEGEYSSVRRALFEGTDHEFVSQQSVFTRKGVDRILKFARAGAHAAEEACDIGDEVERDHVYHAVLGRAVRGDGHGVSGYSDGPVSHRYPVRAFRAASGLVRCGCRINLFGDILSDLGPAVAGSIGIAASANINPERTYPSMSRCMARRRIFRQAYLQSDRERSETAGGMLNSIGLDNDGVEALFCTTCPTWEAWAFRSWSASRVTTTTNSCVGAAV